MQPSPHNPRHGASGLNPEAILAAAGIVAGANPLVVNLAGLPLNEVVLPTGLRLDNSIVVCRPEQALDLRGIHSARGGLLLLNGAKILEGDQSNGALQVVRVPLTDNLTIDEFGSLRLVDLLPTVYSKLHEQHSKVFESGEGGKPSLLVKRDGLQIEAFGCLLVDVLFYRLHPTLPLENINCSLDSYRPETESQGEALHWARRLCALPLSNAAAGLYLEGSAGVGKTHLAVASAKEFLLRGLPTFFLSASDHTSAQTLLSKGVARPVVWILDDVNSPYGAEWDRVKKIAQHAHDYGGIVLVTSNTAYSKMLESGFVSDSENRTRIVDRMRGIFKVLTVDGESSRTRKPWYES